MTWTAEEAHGFKVGMTAQQADTWAAIANAARESCREQGGRQCDQLAIIRANGAMEESMAEQAELERIELAEPKQVELTGDIIALAEKAVAPDNSLTVKIIQPGWGTSGFYSPEMLERDGPTVFPAGTQMFWDHATRTEEREKPEGSLDRLVGKTITDAAWRAEGAAGPGLYADAMAYENWAGLVNELAPDIGMSIRAMGMAKEGKAEGKEGPIITELTAAKSIDYVTMAGAGGKVLQLFESVRKAEENDAMAEVKMQETQEANDALVAENAELKAENVRLQVSLVASEAQQFVSKALAMHKMPEPAYEKLAASLTASPVIVEGKLDKDAYKTAIDEAVTAELAYLASVASVPEVSGAIRGMGESTPQADGAEALFEAEKRVWILQGKTDAEAEDLAKMAARGR